MVKREAVWGRPELRAVTDYAEDFVTLLDRDFRHLFVNRSLAAALERDAADFVGKTLAEVGMPAPLCKRWHQHLRRVLEHGAAEKLEYQARLKDGLRDLQTMIAPVKDGDGEIQALICITRDITDWKRAEALHAGQTEVMRHLAGGANLHDLLATTVRLVEENAPGRFCSVLLLAEDGKHLTPGPAPNLPPALIEALCARPIGADNGCCGAAAAERRMKVSPDIATDPAWTAHRDLLRTTPLKACWSHPILAQDGTLLGTFAMYHTKARKPFPVEVSVVSEAALAAGIAIQHWRTQDSLLETRERFQALTENAANIVIVTGMNATIRYCSPAVEPILGRKPEEVVGQTAFKWLHPDDLPQATRRFVALRKNINEQIFEHYRYQHQDGTWRLLEVSARGRFNHRGEYLAVVSARDITERERMLEQLRESEERLDRALQASALGVWDLNLETGALFMDPHFTRNMGYPADQPSYTLYWLLDKIMPEDRDRVLTNLQAHVKGQSEFFEAEYRAHTLQGEWRWISSRGKVTRRGADGRALRMAGTNNDVTEHKHLQDRLQRALQAAGLGMWDWDVDSGTVYMDDHSSLIMGYLPGELEPNISSLTQIIHGDDALASTRAVEAHLRGETTHYEYDARLRTRDGEWKWITSRGQVTERDAQGNPVRVTGTIKDIDAARRMQDKLETANTQIQLLLDATDEGIVGLDAQGECSFANPAAARLLGYELNEMLMRDFAELVRHTREDSSEIARDVSPIYRCLREHVPLRGTDEFLWRKDGTSFPIEYSVSPLGVAGAGHGAVLVFRDISEKRSLAQQLQHQAMHDPLTGLMNRRGFENKLLQLLGTARAQGRVHALCYVDLDHFKLVNDTCGHAAGDELLRQLPQVLSPLVRKSDTIARLGGDEFAVLLEDCPLEQAARIADAIRDAVRDFRFVWQYRTFSIGASIGVVGVTGESHGLVSVLGAADTACYVAKDQGPNHVHVSYPHDLAIIRRRGEMRWVARIKTALEENQFRLHFQSMIALDKTNAVPMSHELLIRLIDSKGELILPGAFLQAAERYQLMPQIDDWVVEHAIQFLGQTIVPDPRFAGHKFGINLSAESMRDSHLLELVQQALLRHKVPATMLYFEVTETAAISNLGSAVEFMRGLKNLGCQLALDDFGSGMSSFSYLKHLPVDFLKIDGSFIKDIVNNPVDQAIVRAVQAIGQQMGLATIAEYVESKAILECLRGMGVNFAQGHAIARPMPLEDFPMLQAGPAQASA